MTFEIENVYPEVVLPDYETVIKNVIEAALDYEKCPYEAQVYVLLTDNEENPETGELILGDIIISMDKVKEQAKAYGHSNTRELAFLVAHSMLHLMGYDHMVDEERKVMEAKQEEILKNCGYIREMEA